MLSEILSAHPLSGLIVLAFLMTLIITLINKYFTNQDRMKELKEIQKACNIKLKANREDKEAQEQLMKCSFELMKHSFKPLLITMIPLLLFFWWLRSFYSVLLPHWLWWYIGTGIVSSIFLRKTLKVV